MLDSIPDSPILVTLITIAASALTGTVTWLFGRRRSDTEIAEISSRVYSALITDLEDRVDRQSNTIIEQEAKISEQEKKYERVIIYVEKLEDLLVASSIVKRKDLEAIKVSIGI